VIKTIASGSSGNCYAIEHKGKYLLLEAGVPFDEVRPAIDYNTQDIVGCLISHEHGDHAKYVQDFIDRDIDVFASEGTQEALGVEDILTPKKHIRTDLTEDFRVVSFDVNHDAKEPVGWLIGLWTGSRYRRVLYLTDCGYCEYKFNDLEVIMIECNYTKKKLINNIRQGRVKTALKPRLIENHMSLENVKTFLRRNDISNLLEIHLLHLSRKNGEPARMIKEIQLMTGCPTYVAGDDNHESYPGEGITPFRRTQREGI